MDSDSDLAQSECCEAYMILECAWNAIEAALAASRRDRRGLESAVAAAFHAAEVAPASDRGTVRMIHDLRLEMLGATPPGGGEPPGGDAPQVTTSSHSFQAFVQSLDTTRNIVCCLDGTWNHIDSRIPEFTNVHGIFADVSRKNHIKNYLPGVGVHQGAPYKWFYGMTGKGVFRAARLAWEFIAQNHLPGDRIFIFGFSRGAYAARHLAGMIARCGLDGVREVGFDDYMNLVGLPNPSPRQEVHFLGLFDCVPGNLLYTWRPSKRRMNHEVLENGIRHFRHAVSMHERRWSFRPLVFRPEEQGHPSFVQRWFNGYHSDIGGGRGVSHQLSTFSRLWMTREAFELGLQFETIGDCSRHPWRPVSKAFSNAKPTGAAVASDWLTTRLAVRWDRSRLEDDPRIAPTPSLAELHMCPKCKVFW